MTKKFFNNEADPSSAVDPMAEIEALRRALAEANERAERAEAEKEQALKDRITGLPGRAVFDIVFENHFHQMDRHGNGNENENFAVCHIDLDGFKPINDTFGHGVGDKMLQLFTQHMSDKFRVGKDDFLARIGGDEFGIIFSHSSNLKEVEERMLELQKEATSWTIDVDIAGATKTIPFGGFSFGIQSFREDGIMAKSTKEMLDKADAKMYENKKRDGRDPEAERKGKSTLKMSMLQMTDHPFSYSNYPLSIPQI